MSDYLTIKEIAEELRVSKMTIYRLCSSGELPSVRVGHSYRVNKADLDTYLNKKGTTD